METYLRLRVVSSRTTYFIFVHPLSRFPSTGIPQHPHIDELKVFGHCSMIEKHMFLPNFFHKEHEEIAFEICHCPLCS